MTEIPGARPIPDPQAEIERLAAARAHASAGDAPGREWGVEHPDGTVTVTAAGHAFPGKFWAEQERDACNRECPVCGPEPRMVNGHTLVFRDPAPWRDA